MYQVQVRGFGYVRGRSDKEYPVTSSYDKVVTFLEKIHPLIITLNFKLLHNFNFQNEIHKKVNENRLS